MVDLDAEYPDPTITKSNEHIRTAFKKLESTFTNPNSFHLNSFFTIKRDTILSISTETIYSVYFTYSTEENAHLFSKVSVLENKAYMDIFNGDTKTNKEYIPLKTQADQETQKDIKSALDAIREIPDSTKKQLRDAINPN